MLVAHNGLWLGDATASQNFIQIYKYFLTISALHFEEVRW
jgi:hypothetical protein